MFAPDYQWDRNHFTAKMFERVYLCSILVNAFPLYAWIFTREISAIDVVFKDGNYAGKKFTIKFLTLVHNNVTLNVNEMQFANLWVSIDSNTFVTCLIDILTLLLLITLNWRYVHLFNIMHSKTFLSFSHKILMNNANCIYFFITCIISAKYQFIEVVTLQETHSHQFFIHIIKVRWMYFKYKK